MRGRIIFGLVLALMTPQLEASLALPTCQPASCCSGDAPSCPCTAGPEAPEPAEPTPAAVATPAPQAELQPEVWHALGFEPKPAESLPELSRVAPAVYIVTCSFRC